MGSWFGAYTVCIREPSLSSVAYCKTQTLLLFKYENCFSHMSRRVTWLSRVESMVPVTARISHMIRAFRQVEAER